MVAVLVLSAAAAVARAAVDDPEYAPPANGKLTDKQVAACMAVMKEQMDATRDAATAVDGATSTAAKLAIVADKSRKIAAAVGHHGLTAGEYEWVKGQVDAAFPAALVQQQWAAAKPDLERQAKAKQADVKAAEDKHDAAAADAAKRELATVQSVLSAGPAGADADPKPDPDNVNLVCKHLKDYFAALGVPDPAAPPTTAPAGR